MIRCNCDYCGKEIEKTTGHYNRAKKLGAGVFCNKQCSSANRKIARTDEEKKEIKKAYDAKYKNRDYVKQKKREYFARDYAANPEKYKKERQRRYKAHLKYLQRPEYKQYKKQYDRKYRAEQIFGEFGEAAVMLYDLENEIDVRVAKFEQNNYNKSQKRKRLWKNLQRRTSKMPSGKHSTK